MKNNKKKKDKSRSKVMGIDLGNDIMEKARVDLGNDMILGGRRELRKIKKKRKDIDVGNDKGGSVPPDI